jgi:hypothetical protein
MAANAKFQGEKKAESSQKSWNSQHKLKDLFTSQCIPCMERGEN